jgi:hypothetical protein
MRRSQLRAAKGERGVAMLMVLMLVAGLLVLGQSAMLVMGNVAKKSGSFRRSVRAQYCADEGLNLGRAWVLQQLKGFSALPDGLLSGNPPGTGTGAGAGLMADPLDINDMSSPTKDLCRIPAGVATTIGGVAIPSGGLGGLCRTDAAGNPMYRINLIDDVDDPVVGGVNPFLDRDEVFLIRAECLVPEATVVLDPTAKPPDTPENSPKAQVDVAMVEVNQAGATYCYGPSGSGAGCGGGYAN